MGNIISAIILGLIQGLTEFFPISSSGHLLVLPELIEALGADLDFSFQNTEFDLALHTGTFLAILFFYRDRFIQAFKQLKSNKGKLFFRNLAITSTPALAIGGVMYVTGVGKEQSSLLASITLIIGGLMLIVIEHYINRNEKEREGSSQLSNNNNPQGDIDLVANISAKSALIIGLFQSIALIRGVSRSGATMIGGFTQKLSRLQALDYAFIASIPVFFMGTLIEFLQFIKEFLEFGTNANEGRLANLEGLIAGSIASFISGFIVIYFFRKIINYKNSLKIFGFYRIVLGLIILSLIFPR